MNLLPEKKDLSQLSKLEQEREKRKQAHEQNELIEEMGQDDERKALSTVQAYVKELKAIEEKQKELSIDQLNKLTGDKPTYQRYLLTLLAHWIKEEDIPKKYKLYVDSTDEGIVLGIENTIYQTAIKPSGVPLYDIHACKIMAIKLGNTVGKLEGNLNQTKGGVLVGSKEEMNLAIQGVKMNGRSRKSRTKKNA